LAPHPETGGTVKMNPKKIIEPTLHEEDDQARLIEVMEDTQFQEDSDYEESASLHEVEAEIGIADWVDPDTGELAECSSPHFSD
jgi:hypothetical protein